jgi:hypothetical protein
VSRAPLPNLGVTSVGETWSVSWEGVTPPSSLVLAHAPLPLGSLLLRFLASFGESLQVVTSPCCPRQLPDVIPRTFPWMLDPLPRRYPACSRLFLPRCHRPSPTECGSASRIYPANDFSQGNFRGCRYFVMFRPPSLLAPRIVPTAASTAAGQLGLLSPGLSCFVASTRPGYANRLNTGN